VRKLVVAHRGDHTRARENTAEAFLDAIVCGADMIEFDVRRTADARLVVHHDGEIAGRAIAEMEYAQVLQQAPYRVPLLSEALDLAAGKIQIDVELKEAGYEGEVLRQILDHGFHPDDFVITSFLVDVLTTLGGGARTGLLVEDIAWDDALQLYRMSKVNFLAPEHALVRNSPAIPLLPWLVNEEAVLHRLLTMPNVFGVITDLPRPALRVRDALTAP